MPSLKITAPKFLEIFLIQYFVVYVELFMLSSLSSSMSFAKYKHANISKTSKRQFSVDEGKLTAIATWKMTFRASDQSALLPACEAAGEESGSNVFAFTAMT